MLILAPKIATRIQKGKIPFQAKTPVLKKSRSKVEMKWANGSMPITSKTIKTAPDHAPAK